jgi:Protein of unknown function (DUF2845)
MRIANLLALWFCGALIAGLAPAVARADAFRCGSKLASEGDTLGQVVAKCGQPTDIVNKTILRPAVIWRDGRPWRVGDGQIEVVVEIWTYNLGPAKLMRRLRFEDGALVAIDTLGRGYR